MKDGERTPPDNAKPETAPPEAPPLRRVELPKPSNDERSSGNVAVLPNTDAENSDGPPNATPVPPENASKPPAPPQKTSLADPDDADFSAIDPILYLRRLIEYQ